MSLAAIFIIWVCGWVGTFSKCDAVRRLFFGGNGTFGRSHAIAVWDFDHDKL